MNNYIINLLKYSSYKYHKKDAMKKLLLIVMLILCCVGIFYGIHFGEEKTARFQNNLNLHAVKSCLDSSRVEPFNKAISICATNIRSIGITGDIFVIKKDDKLIFWDESLDAKTTDYTKTFMTPDGMCTLFLKPETCIDAIEKMIKVPSGEVTWQFDDDIEWINYITYTHDEVDYIIGQGSQFDEIDSNFKLVEIMLISFTFILIIFIIIV